jgi:DNA-binding CsgD family transcriptional regulator
VIAEIGPNTAISGEVSGSAPKPVRAWRLIAGGSDRTAFDPVLVETALHLLIEHFEQGLAVTDRCGRVQFLNRAARAYLGRGLLRLEQGCLRGTKPADAAALRRIIADAAAGHGGSARLEGEGAPLLVAAGAVPGGAVLLRLVDPAAARLPTAAMLQEQFGFTPAEAALAVDILAGNDLAASAAHRRITRNTARVHLRHLFEKTGTRRQAELMRLLLLCPQPIAAAQSGGTEISAPGPLSRSNGGCGYKTIQRR